MKVSNCCGVHPAQIEDMDSRDYGICPKCGEHCEFEDDGSDLFTDMGLSDIPVSEELNKLAVRDTTAAVDLFAKMGEYFAPVNISTIKKAKQ